ncbi:alpha-glucuronidase family glycosyl hydrolase [Butyrivibrio sp. NC3005]|uniref:alpha-glucuronidase family glycosyl hydrolase n=1 Tax=Butyrivibrio sp. NC3005 TaxID=1280685 RepID=UPI0004103A9F|nr:alpha-glucuronidase family glycosyl hydrolase [Butyrivibrio sp. NC3005]
MKNWTDLWLGYHKVNVKKADELYSKSVGKVYLEGFLEDESICANAIKELTHGLKQMIKVSVKIISNAGGEIEEENAVVIKKDDSIKKQGYRYQDNGKRITISAPDENGMLYGVFALLRNVAMQKERKADELCEPSNPLRMLNHWDNMDGSIERGYSGESFFFKNGKIMTGSRIVDYARMIASVGINGVVINNVNVKGAATYLISERYYLNVKKLAEIFGSYGISLYLSLNFAAPIEMGGMDSCDPLDENVILWWKNKVWEVFNHIPNLGGFLVKADSEGRPGPFTYGRTQAEGANMLADIVKEYDATIIWRCFVYNCTQDWRDTKTDRARAAYDNFKPSDGNYHENVVLQIKNGPMDFQIREPVSPLFGALSSTNEMLEVQIAQEYTGHQIDICYLIPMFKEILNFRTYCKDECDTVADVVSGRTFGNTCCGFSAVTNTGDDENWTGNDMAAANLYGFGRLAFNTELSAEEIAREWVKLTFNVSKEAEDVIVNILMNSREIYEEYTSPLGIGWMVTPQTHYGCSVDGYEYSRWGTYHRADHLGIGVDRTENGTGYVSQYFEPNASIFADVNKCPEELVLFFHHLPYTHKLHSGKTLIQHIYDTHFEGYERVLEMQKNLEGIKDELDQSVYDRVSGRMNLQVANAREWCDQVNSYFYRKSGIEDEKGRKIY